MIGIITPQRKLLILVTVALVSAAIATINLVDANELMVARELACEGLEAGCEVVEAGSKESRSVFIGLVSLILFFISATYTVLWMIMNALKRTVELSPFKDRLLK